jgi:hypothetical protein
MGTGRWALVGIGITIVMGVAVLVVPDGWQWFVAIFGGAIGVAFIVIPFALHAARRWSQSYSRQSQLDITSGDGEPYQQRWVLRGAATTLIDEGERYIATMVTGSPENQTAFASWKKRAGEFLNAVDIYEIADRDWHRAVSAIEQAGRLVAALKDIRDRTR